MHTLYLVANCTFYFNYMGSHHHVFLPSVGGKDQSILHVDNLHEVSLSHRAMLVTLTLEFLWLIGSYEFIKPWYVHLLSKHTC